MKKYLLVSGSSENAEVLSSITRQASSAMTDLSFTSSEAGQLMESGQYDAMIVNTPLQDSQGHDLCVYVCEKLHYPVILITSKAAAERIGSHFREKGIIVSARPVEKSSYRLMLNCLASSAALAADLRKTIRDLEGELKERRLVARAKAILMNNMGMTEDQAHRFIEKQAMNLRLPKKEIAQSILKTYYDK